jgi:NTP pyrophosphatase (non-canonical NTP hydrolase)
MQVPYQTKTVQSRLVLASDFRHNGAMDMNDYQAKARETAIYPNQGENYIYPVLGLVGETGEVAEKIKKIIRDEGGQLTAAKVADIKKELGDVMWYLAQLSTELGLSLEEIAQGNLEKLASRHKQNMIHGDGDNREEGR